MFKVLENKLRTNIIMVILIMLFVFFTLIFSSYASILHKDFVEKSIGISNYIAQGIEQKLYRIEQATYMFTERFDIQNKMPAFDPISNLKIADYWGYYDVKTVILMDETYNAQLVSIVDSADYKSTVNFLKDKNINDSLSKKSKLWLYFPDNENVLYISRISSETEKLSYLVVGFNAQKNLLNIDKTDLYFKEHLFVKIQFQTGGCIVADLNGLLSEQDFPAEQQDISAQIRMNDGVQIDTVILKKNLYRHIYSYLFILICFFCVLLLSIIFLLNFVIKRMIMPMQNLYDKMNDFDVEGINVNGEDML